MMIFHKLLCTRIIKVKTKQKTTTTQTLAHPKSDSITFYPLDLQQLKFMS